MTNSIDDKLLNIEAKATNSKMNALSSEEREDISFAKLLEELGDKRYFPKFKSIQAIEALYNVCAMAMENISENGIPMTMHITNEKGEIENTVKLTYHGFLVANFYEEGLKLDLISQKLLDYINDQMRDVVDEARERLSHE